MDHFLLLYILQDLVANPSHFNKKSMKPTKSKKLLAEEKTAAKLSNGRHRLSSIVFPGAKQHQRKDNEYIKKNTIKSKNVIDFDLI